MDDFYCLTDVSSDKIKEIFLWAEKHAISINIDMLDGKSIRRTRADKTFHEIVNSITSRAVDFFRLIHLKKWNGWGIVKNNEEYDEIIELFIRNIGKDPFGSEYFIFLYLSTDKLYYLFKNYSFEKI